MNGIHGGDIYRNRVRLDFSVNVNPLGTPDVMKTALKAALKLCGSYPDMEAEKLKKAVGGMLCVPEEYLLFGNGASELLMAVVHGVRPRRTMIPTPSFYGYEYAAKAADSEIVYFPLKEQTGFLPGEDLLDALTEDVDLLFLANPNNPTGRLPEKAYLCRLLDVCRQNKIVAVLDECFIEFCEEGRSMLSELENYENLVIVRAFTKIFAIPGVRLGYLLCSDPTLLNRIKRQLPEWNLSVFAQAAGSVCGECRDFLGKTAAYVRAERKFLAERFAKMGLRVFPGDANFLLVCSRKNLYEELLRQEILIRDCENYRGLSKGFYRIAVKSGQDNEALIKAMEQI